MALIKEWRDVLGAVGYQVSNTGEVRSFRPPNGRGALSETPRPVAQSFGKGKPYLRVGLFIKGVIKWRPVHQLVCEAFHGPRPPGLEVRHLNGCHTDNMSTNLKWGTTQENADDRTTHGTKLLGESVKLSVLTEEQAKEVIAHFPLWKKGDGRAFALKFGVSDSAISSIRNGRTWSHLWQ